MIHGQVARPLAIAVALSVLGPAGRGQEVPDARTLLRRLEAMEARHRAEMDEIRKGYETRIDGLEKDLGTMRGRVEELEAGPPDAADRRLEDALDRALGEVAPVGPREPVLAKGPGRLQLLDISMDILFAAGSSSERDASLQSLQGGGHDPRKRGFTVQNVELSLVGAVDPYFIGEVHLITFLDPLEGETVVELEEAFLVTQSLPFGLQVEAGTFFTEFGRINPRHPHAWEFIDQPVVNSRFFGPDGLRGPGVRVGWLTPLPWFSELHLGVQNANGETAASFLANDELFEERAIGGRPFVERDVRALEDLLYLVRFDNGVDLGEEVGLKAGISALFGPNATGPDGATWILGADLVLRWRPADAFKGWPFFLWQSEVMFRRYTADAFFDEGDPADPLDDLAIPGDRLDDWGLYTQALYGFAYGWAAGLRYEFAGGEGRSFDLESGSFIPRGDDPFRDDRHRFSALLVYHPSEFSRLRLQYNWDHADHLEGGDAHSVWLGVEILFGSHPAHEY